MDDRPLKIIARMNDPALREAWTSVATKVLQTADEEGKDLQFEFGKEHVSFIVGCNQFLRIYKAGEHEGTGEILPGPNFDLEANEAVGGMVFKMFGWKHVRMQPDVLAAVLDAYQAASAKGAPS